VDDAVADQIRQTLTIEWLDHAAHAARPILDIILATSRPS
jgi:hypothetical protein